jgi:D-glycero-D-manno-heptose 1,7-bisphosphate phosphatase
MNRAVFLDRDGTLIKDKDYLSRPEEIEVLAGVGRSLGRLMAAGFKLFMVSNQSGVGRGYFTMAEVDRVNARLMEEFHRDGVMFDKIYIAPEAPGGPSRGRKPSPQFLFDARDEFFLDLAESYMIGDKMIDLECGWNAGVKKSILVQTGYGKTVAVTEKDGLANAVIVEDMPAAADWIINAECNR